MTASVKCDVERMTQETPTKEKGPRNIAPEALLVVRT
jgi:hypothetical protein